MAGRKSKNLNSKVVDNTTIINSEDNDGTKGGSQGKAQREDDHNSKGEKIMAEEKQGAIWPEMLTGMWKSFPGLNMQNKGMEPFMKMTKVQQQQYMKMYSTCMEFSKKMAEAGRSGDVKKLTETCMESSQAFIQTWQDSMKEQAEASYQLWKSYIPALPDFPEIRT